MPDLSEPHETAQPCGPIAVLVVDDQLAVREGVARLIACAPVALRVVGTAATSAQALAAAARLQPDVVVLDVDLDGEDGLALIPRFAKRTRVLVLTCHGDAVTRARAMRLGADAFVDKHAPAATLLGSIVDIAAQRQVAQTREEEPHRRDGDGSRAPTGTSSAAPGHPRL